MSSAFFFFASVVVHIRFCRNGAFLRRSNFVEEPPITRFFCALVRNCAQEQRVPAVTADFGEDIIVLKLEVVVVVVVVSSE